MKGKNFNRRKFLFQSLGWTLAWGIKKLFDIFSGVRTKGTSFQTRNVSFSPGEHLPSFPKKGFLMGTQAAVSDSSTLDIPNGNIFQTPFVNVKGFGAQGDGKTDDTQAIKNALKEMQSGALAFPAGSYKISDTLSLKSNIDIVGFNAEISCDPIFGKSYTPFFLAKGIENVSISGIIVNGKGRWTSTPFGNPYGGGSSVGFTNNLVGLHLRGGSSNIRIKDCQFTGLGRGILGGGFNCQILNNYIHQCGVSGIYLGHGKKFQLIGNRIAGIRGNLTEPGETNLEESRFADGIHLNSCQDILVSHNIVEDCARIGIVLEGVDGHLNERIVITGNHVFNMHGSRKRELNGGIWSETNKSASSITISGNSIDDCADIGIQAYNCNISGNTVMNCFKGIHGTHSNLFSNTVEKNFIGVRVRMQNADESFVISNNKIAHNQIEGIQIYKSRGHIEISNNIIEDNGDKHFFTYPDYGAGIKIKHFYNDQHMMIRGNSFISSLNRMPALGQICGIVGVAGGDFDFTTRWISNNTFLFTGMINDYDANLNEAPCSFGFDDNSSLTFHEICGWNGNINSKLPQPDLITSGFGQPRFMGFISHPPTSGAFRHGDYFLNNKVAEADFMGWVCVTGGDPGLWKGFGILQ